MYTRPSIPLLTGALLVVITAFIGGAISGGEMASRLGNDAKAAAAALNAPTIQARFTTLGGWPTRHPLLSGGQDLSEEKRAKAAMAIASIPGVGGIRWIDGSIMAQRDIAPLTPMHCQDDVRALLRARTVRFEESSTEFDPNSLELLDEVSAALRPCLGSIIAITGHTDSSGPEPGNIELSLSRAQAVNQALIRRGIPADGLRARGVGSSMPVEGLDPADPANRRIEFSVIATVPLAPTPVDTPGPR